MDWGVSSSDWSAAVSRVLAAVLTFVALPLLAPSEARALTIAGPTSEWVGIVYPGLTPDPGDDHQTGQPEADIVGNTSLAALFTQYDAGALPSTSDDVLAFRMRMGSQENPAGYSHVAMVGMDADLDGSLDIFIVLNNTGQDAIELYTTGTGSNTSPNTTSTSVTAYTYAETGLNYDWTIVSVVNCSECTGAPDLDLDVDGNTDYFLSFSVPFDDIVAVLALDGITGVTPSTQVSYVIGTSVNPNAYNQDLGGVNGDPSDPSLLWTDPLLGAMSTPAGINPVPEPGTALLLSLGLSALAASRRRR
jgi:hypothetical protein